MRLYKHNKTDTFERTCIIDRSLCDGRSCVGCGKLEHEPTAVIAAQDLSPLSMDDGRDESPWR